MNSYNYYGISVFVRVTKYHNNRPAIQLFDATDLEPYAVASVNVVNDDQYMEGEVVIKNYSENVGMLQFLLDNRLITKPHRWVKTGFVMCPVVYLTDTLTNMLIESERQSS